jgi:hypothetical protein
LVYQLEDYRSAYREAARVALWESTITDEDAALALALQLVHRKPELREVARQVLQAAKINITDAEIKAYVESAQRRSRGKSDNN